MAELTRISDKLLDSRDQFLAAGFQIDSVASIALDSDDIVVSGSPVKDVPPGISDAAKQLESQVAAVANAVAAVPVTVDLTTKTTNAAGTRQNASLPLYAGAFMVSSANGQAVYCSTNFTYVYGGNMRSSTARHCIPPSGSWRAPNAFGTNFGNNLVTTQDAALTLITGAGAARTFDNEYNNAAGFSKPVGGTIDVGLNTIVCTEGANSGAHCNAKVNNMSVVYNDGYGNVSTISATTTSSAMVVAEGDSGGPVLIPSAAPSRNVYALGIIQAGRTVQGEPSVDCSAVEIPASCYRTVLFSSVNTAVRYGGLSGLRVAYSQ